MKAPGSLQGSGSLSSIRTEGNCHQVVTCFKGQQSLSSEEAITLPDSACAEPGVESMVRSGQGGEVAGGSKGAVQLARSFPRLLEARNSPHCA